MLLWDSLTNLINNPSIQNFFLSCAASASWDTVKVLLEKAKDNDSFESQLYQVLEETFNKFYKKYNLEYDEKIVMTSFLQSIKSLSELDNSIISKKLICDTIGLEINNQQLEEWIKSFMITCSNPKYQWVHNKLSLSSINISNEANNKSWMNTYMQNNYCKIQCDMTDALPPIFNDISTKLSPACWYDTQILIWEIVFNAQEHGNAQKCMLHIEERSITILDDGAPFNPLNINTQTFQKGGSIAVEKYLQKYPEIILNSTYEEKCNKFKISFNDNIFDINQMSEITIPSLIGYNCSYKLKHPKGTFKHYYIDIDEIPRTHNNQLFSAFSGLIGLFTKLKNDIKPLDEYSKIFIYFSDMTRVDYQKIFENMNMLLEEYGYNKEGISIELVREDFI